MSKTVNEAVRESYGSVARQGLGSHQEGIKGIANAFGYSEDELASIPDEANMGLSCGNPVALASIAEGETVVDLGSGGGLDVFLASKLVGKDGLAIGVDMTGDMISLARKNAARGGYDNVKFHLAEIEAMPIPSGSVDCVISNCVLNLCEDKDAALREVFRILKPGGRLAISDIALKQTLPPEVEQEVAAWTGCIAGALTIEDNRSKLQAAGFSEIDIHDAHSDLNIYKEGGAAACCGPATTATSCCEPTEPVTDENAYHDRMRDLLDSFDANDYAASVKIFGLKPQ